MMIRIGLLMMIMVFAGACNTPKPVAEEKPVEETKTEDLKREGEENYYLGWIDMTNSCGLVIQVRKGEEKYTFNPVNLDPKFQVENMRVKLSFTRLDEKGENGCRQFEAIKIIEIFAVR